jgi:glutathione S-transferase
VSAGKPIHVVLDNYAARKHPKVMKWLSRHPRWTYHFTPTSSSWLNAVEGFFAKLHTQRLKRGVIHSLVSLQAINHFVAETNDDPKPFHWTKDPDKIIAAVKRGHHVLDRVTSTAQFLRQRSGRFGLEDRPMFTLFYAPGSSSMASHIALEEASAEYETTLVDEDAGEQRSEAYLTINPRGKVPALRLGDGTILVENIAIQTYVARTHPDANLLPTDPIGEARALSLMSFFASAVHPAFAHVWRPGRFTSERSAEPTIRTRALGTFFDYCREIDSSLAGKEWFLGQFSTVDAYGFIFYGWGKRVDLPMHELPNYAAHQNRMLLRPAVRRVLQQEGVTLR